jgi:peptide/nickel transport system permease protein
MPPLIRYLIKRVFSAIATLLVISAVLYAVVMLTPPETRATLYMPKKFSPRMTEQQYQNLLDQMIRRYHLNDPFPVQYYYWITNLLQGSWGYSPTLQEDVLTAILRRAPVTAELTLYSMVMFIPFGLLSGVLAGSRQNRLVDHQFRLTAFIATSFPPFILSLILIAIFYVNLYWFAPERTGSMIGFFVHSDQFRAYTGLLTIDGLLNGRPDISLDALRHLVMPVFTLAISQWATLGRITRVSVIEELQKEYVVAAKARGISRRRIVWRHILRNAFAPALTSSLLSAASLLTGVFVVEIIFSFHGISEIAVRSMQFIPDAPAAMGFAIYSVIVVLILMNILDLVLAALDPRMRSGI